MCTDTVSPASGTSSRPPTKAAAESRNRWVATAVTSTGWGCGAFSRTVSTPTLQLSSDGMNPVP